jgi:hypothetical protein
MKQKTQHIHCLGFAAAATEVCSSTGTTIDRSHANITDSASAFERKGCAFERSTTLLVWNKGVRSHAEVCHACERTQRCVRRAQVCRHSGIGGSTFDRKNCVRPHCQRLIFQKLNRNQKQGTKMLIFFFFF